jgi:hypothetical protein
MEVVRVATDGTPNACSILYAACARAARVLGFSRIVTYVLEDEAGTSVRAAGWTQDEGEFGNLSWVGGKGRQQRADKVPGPKGRWSLTLAGLNRPSLTLPAAIESRRFHDPQLRIDDEESIRQTALEAGTLRVG